MWKFIIKVNVFIFITIILFVALLFSLPPTPRATESFLFASIKKDSLLLNESSPRIIFLGGSNLSLGLNSEMIKDSLKLNPINTGIGAAIGIRYMLENTLQYVKKGDIVVFAPEYWHFYSGWNLGSETLVHLIMDVNKSKIKLLSLKQIFNCTPFIGNYILSKLDISAYLNVEKNDLYGVNSFNQYGDSYRHWNMERIKFNTYTILFDLYNHKVIKGVKTYTQKYQEKGAVLLVSYPCYQDISFKNAEKAIKKIEQEYISAGFTILGTPERYMMPDSLMFDTPYHPNKAGVDRRTRLLIEDIRKQIYPN
jgi:hypothetical protein